MKHIRRASLLLALLFLTACGTIQVEYIPVPTFFPDVLPTPTAMNFAISPEECSKLKNDTTLPDNPDDPGSYIGRHYDVGSLPEGLVYETGDTLTDNGEFMWEAVNRLNVKMEFIVQANCRRTDGSTYSTILDAIQFPQETPGYGRAGYCLPDPFPGPFFVFGRYDKTQPEVKLGGEQGWAMFNLDFAKHIDLQTMRFAPYSLEGIQCLRLSRQGG